jgi:hypothetical protein
LAAPVLAACELYLGLGLFNDTGMPITVLTESGPLDIASSQSVEFRYPDNLVNWTLRISDGRCEYRYQVPKSLQHYPWPRNYGASPKAQVERDFSIYAVPSSATGITNVSALADQQKDGFPLHPLARNCH